MTGLHYNSLSDTCRRIKSGEFTSVQVTEALLARIEALEGELRAFAMVTADEALKTAEAQDRKRRSGAPLGLLHGVPVAVKDLLQTVGLATASGTQVMADFVPEQDATAVRRLREAGAVIIGKTQLTEGAFSTHHPQIDAPRNPWHLDHWPGVSSSGSGVAVAAGLAFGALGSDTGGSIRFPSAACGLVGVKPTYGRVSRHGAFPLAESLDHIGPMTRTVEDGGRMLQAIAGADPEDSTTLPNPVPNYVAPLDGSIGGLRIGVDWDYVATGVNEDVTAVVRSVVDRCRELGAEILEVRMPSRYAVLVENWIHTCAAECVKAHAPWFPEQRRKYGPALAELLDLGASLSPDVHATLEREREAFRVEFDELLTGIDVLVAPAMPIAPPRLEAMQAAIRGDGEQAALITFTAPFDYSGHPTVTLQVGLFDDGLPKSVQFIGRWLDETTLLRAAYALEQSLQFSEHPLP
ncbi:MAG: amidase [Gammaproteobacteria bacterium]|nr:amidase [Gammaproteobacteria bacterium]